MQQSFIDHARFWGYDPEELLAFYRGLGPHPKKLDAMAKAIERIAERQEPAAPIEVYPAKPVIEYLGGGWYRLASGEKARGLKAFEGQDDPYEREEEV